MSTETLETRPRLPDALRVLLEDYPREAWEAHPNFAGLVQFWMERHLMFRRLMAMIDAETAALLDGRTGAEAYRPKLARYGGLLLNQLHEHHHIEDLHYFPKMSRMDARLEKGFALLDTDHHALDALMREYAEAANAVLAPGQGPVEVRETAAAFAKVAGRFGGLVGRHLEDEEDLVVPILLRHGAPGM